MKSLIIAIGMCLVFTCYAQTVKITKKDGSSFETSIGAYNTTTLFITAQTIDIKDISQVDFQMYKASDAKLHKLLKANDIAIGYDYEKGNVQPTPIAIETKKIEESKDPDISAVVNSLEEFRKARQPAKAMELVGILAVGGSIVMQSIFNKQYDDDIEAYLKNPKGSAPEQKNVSPIIPAVGLGFFTLGLGLDLGAGGKLKLKR